MTDKAALFRSLHLQPPIFVLPNAWDAASARIFEAAGFPAVATTSAGVAYALGYPDGEAIPRDEMLRQVARITAVVKVPVTADVEAGYGDPVETARLVWQAGAVGINLEDMIGADHLSLEEAAARVRGVHEAVPGLVINARCDIYLAAVGSAETRFERTVERLHAYAAAGAGCVFVPGVRDEELIGRLAQAAGAPLNILATAGTPSTRRLQELGVARVSTGSGPMRATLKLVQRIAAELRGEGTYSAYTEDTLPYPEANRLFQE
jgi:2-methylisocitrate lyase-like PEP mutase family enzyme